MFGFYLYSHFSRGSIYSPVNPTHFYVYVCTRGQGKLQEICHRFEPALTSRNGAFQGTPTPVVPSARDTIIAQRGTSLRIFFWLGRLIEACGGRGWKFQCILSSVDTFLVLSYSTSSVVFMWWSMVLRSIFLIL